MSLMKVWEDQWTAGGRVVSVWTRLPLSPAERLQKLQKLECVKKKDLAFCRATIFDCEKPFFQRFTKKRDVTFGCGARNVYMYIYIYMHIYKWHMHVHEHAIHLAN